MSDDSNFSANSSGKSASEEEQRFPETALGLTLLRGFLLLKNEQRLQVIELVNRLAHSSRLAGD